MQGIRMKRILPILNFILVATHLFGQQPESSDMSIPPKSAPIIIEPFISQDGTSVFTLFNKRIAPQSRFGIYSISEFYGVYEVDNQPFENQYMAQVNGNVELFKNFSLNAGVILTKTAGFRPSAGFLYQLRSRNFFWLFSPRFDLSQTYNSEIFSFIEYAPKFKNNWGLYTRLQGLYNHNTKNKSHAFSYLRARVGSLYKVYRFGIAGNFSFYGPDKMNENQFGVFIGALLF